MHQHIKDTLSHPGLRKMREEEHSVREEDLGTKEDKEGETSKGD